MTSKCLKCAEAAKMPNVGPTKGFSFKTIKTLKRNQKGEGGNENGKNQNDVIGIGDCSYS